MLRRGGRARPSHAHWKLLPNPGAGVAPWGAVEEADEAGLEVKGWVRESSSLWILQSPQKEKSCSTCQTCEP